MLKDIPGNVLMNSRSVLFLHGGRQIIEMGCLPVGNIIIIIIILHKVFTTDHTTMVVLCTSIKFFSSDLY